MIWKLTLGRWRFTFSMATTVKVVGVNSNVGKGKHILMWDFDDTTLRNVMTDLLVVQKTYKLPNIYILETKKEQNYIAYCFKVVTMKKAVEIIAFTKGVCWSFLKYAMMRSKFTLRVTAKHGRKPKLAMVLPSKVKADITLRQLRNWTEYDTLADDADTRVKEIEVK